MDSTAARKPRQSRETSCTTMQIKTSAWVTSHGSRFIGGFTADVIFVVVVEKGHLLWYDFIRLRFRLFWRRWLRSCTGRRGLNHGVRGRFRYVISVFQATQIFVCFGTAFVRNNVTELAFPSKPTNRDTWGRQAMWRNPIRRVIVINGVHAGVSGDPGVSNNSIFRDSTLWHWSPVRLNTTSVGTHRRAGPTVAWAAGLRGRGGSLWCCIVLGLTTKWREQLDTDTWRLPVRKRT